jgi:hypothetical protein
LSKSTSVTPSNALFTSENFTNEFVSLKLNKLPSALSGRNSILLFPSMIQLVKLAAIKSLVSMIS